MIYADEIIFLRVNFLAFKCIFRQKFLTKLTRKIGGVHTILQPRNEVPCIDHSHACLYLVSFPHSHTPPFSSLEVWSFSSYD